MHLYQKHIENQFWDSHECFAFHSFSEPDTSSFLLKRRVAALFMLDARKYDYPSVHYR